MPTSGDPVPSNFPFADLPVRKLEESAYGKSQRVHWPLSTNDSQLLDSMAAGKRQNMRDNFPEKLIRVHKHCKVASRNRDKFFSRCLNRFEIFPGKLRRCGEIFRSLEEKHRNCKFESELLHRFGPRLGDEAFAAQNLAIDRIVQISNEITGSDQSKSKGPVEESIRAFETVRPFALYAVALTVRVGRRTNALQLIEGLLVACSPSLLQ